MKTSSTTPSATAKTLAAKPLIDSSRAGMMERVERIRARRGRPPHLAVVLVGDDPGSLIYTTQKGRRAEELGMTHSSHHFPATASEREVRALVDALNMDSQVDGILIQRPLPPSFQDIDRWVIPPKDVDAFHPENLGATVLGRGGFAPCTPTGIMELLRFHGIDVAGRLACVLGRSAIVGKPMAALLLNADATVIHCHSRTPALRDLARQASILVAAVGRRGFVDSSYVAPGATVMDVGIHRDPLGKVVGDVDPASVSRVAGALTPVPGGVGPMTIWALMTNTIRAADRK